MGKNSTIGLYKYQLIAGWLETARTRDFTLLWRAIFASRIKLHARFIAEVFRAGIQEVGKEQIEKRQKALGLS